MRERLVDLVHPIIRTALELRDRADPEEMDLGREQAALRQMLTAEEMEREICYALTCWIDDLFGRHSQWKKVWNQRRLEESLYGTRDGAWKFWEMAKSVPADSLEVFHLCVMLGFRGELLNCPERLGQWLASIRGRLIRGPVPAWNTPPELEPPRNMAPLTGRLRWKKLLLTVCGLFLFLIPATFFFLQGRD